MMLLFVVVMRDVGSLLKYFRWNALCFSFSFAFASYSNLSNSELNQPSQASQPANQPTNHFVKIIKFILKLYIYGYCLMPLPLSTETVVVAQSGISRMNMWVKTKDDQLTVYLPEPKFETWKDDWALGLAFDWWWWW